jgi:outer membrane protein
MGKLVALIGCLSLCASPAYADTLAEAVALAYRTNPDIQASRYDLRAADEDVVQALAEIRPTLDLQLEGGYARSVAGRARRLDNPFLPRADNSDTARGQLSAVQPLYTGGRATADRRIAEAGVWEGRAALRRSEGDLLLAVITAYVDVRRYTAALEVWRMSIAELTRLSLEIEARQVAGELTLTDVAQARRQVAEAGEQAVLTEEALEAARTDYAALVGREPGTLMQEPPLPQLPQDAVDAYATAETRSPELMQVRSVEQRSRAGISAARSQGLPTLSLRGNATVGGEALPFRLRDQNQDYSGSFVFTLPLIAGGRVASQIRQAEDRNSGDRARIEATRRELARSINIAWNQMVTAGRAMSLQRERRQAALIQLEGSTAEYRLGLRSTFDVLYAQQVLRDTEVSLLASRRDRYVAEAGLLRRSGLLEVSAIMTGVPLHNPAANLQNVDNDNALPWDGLLRALDAAGTPAARQRLLQRPGLPSAPPIIAQPTNSTSGEALSRSLVNRPAPGTVGRSSRQVGQR